MKKLIKTLIIFTYIFPVSLLAHPHFFIDSSVIIDNTKIEHTWKFDRLNSRLLMFDFDINKNKFLEEEEQKRFIKAHFSVLEKDNYNMFIETENGEENIIPKNINIQFNEKKIVINFITKITDIKNVDSMTFCTIDPILYMAFSLKSTESDAKLNIQKSKYDYCIGVTQ